MSYCPECEAVIDEEFDDVGEVISCPECGVELEVISVDPLEFDLAPVDDEDEEENRNLELDDDDTTRYPLPMPSLKCGNPLCNICFPLKWN